MARKSAAAAVSPIASLPNVAFATIGDPPVAAAASTSAPVATPATRKRARRAKVEAPPVAPAPVPVEITIDLSQRNAKDALTRAFPRPTSDRMIKATPELNEAAMRYFQARDAAAIAEGAKERAGNELRNAIRSDAGIIGDGWEATWKAERGEIDWAALLKHLNVPSELVEQFRKPDKRVLRVKETATE